MSTTPPSLPPELAAQLEQLRDIRLPPEISWWPLAPGYWLVAAALTLLALALVGVLIWRRYTLKYAALRELAALRAQAEHDPACQPIAIAVGVLLRRIALRLPDGRELASAHGAAWQTFLGQQPNGLAPPVARFIANAPYQPATEAPADLTARRLLDATEGWIRRHA